VATTVFPAGTHLVRATQKNDNLSLPVDLARFLSPCSREEFVGSFWERSPLLLKRNEVSFYRDLFDLDAFQNVVMSSAIKPSNLMLFKNGNRVEESEYAADDYANLR
jgi:hypothetical protein